MQKRKWQDFYAQAEGETKGNIDFAATKHCQMGLLVQQYLEHISEQKRKTEESLWLHSRSWKMLKNLRNGEKWNAMLQRQHMRQKKPCSVNNNDDVSGGAN